MQFFLYNCYKIDVDPSRLIFGQLCGQLIGARNGPFHVDVSLRAYTFCPPLLITNKQEGGWSLSCYILLLSTVSYRKYLFE